MITSWPFKQQKSFLAFSPHLDSMQVKVPQTNLNIICFKMTLLKLTNTTYNLYFTGRPNVYLIKCSL